ncbi:MAG: hypothetical protein G01um101448_223 [Parcubacteria group bacterium Gr01-1014_48]|nr:MAG: hypothetical protein Greene041614_651 [Parcubacteria group bacterium Greene0416_14]TSC74279.1 MAG: hypothetical protein G01um101448_223 [Parcubacteria group bacterium Gr01-1014_48]TSD01376.1 MAG: hypothetical protein Greene101415_311 [Parcubacteria group bacterium Greene1014_15]TSD08295.1 MAG: hypothetical protein Greene07144_213 [Parcubacteria group bacterium Greene0714_4]
MAYDDIFDDASDVSGGEEDITGYPVRLRVDVTFSHEVYEYLLSEATERKISVAEAIADACATVKMLDDHNKDTHARPAQTLEEFLASE